VAVHCEPGMASAMPEISGSFSVHTCHALTICPMNHKKEPPPSQVFPIVVREKLSHATNAPCAMACAASCAGKEIIIIIIIIIIIDKPTRSNAPLWGPGVREVSLLLPGNIQCASFTLRFGFRLDAEGIAVRSSPAVS